MSKNHFPSELRYDLVSKDWVVIATGRAKRPETFRREGRGAARKTSSPFKTLKGQERPTIAFLNGERVAVPRHGYLKEWSTVSVPNKYPAFTPDRSLTTRIVGPYEVTEGFGYHEVVITRDHEKDIPELPLEKVRELVEVYHLRYLELMADEFVNYISIFKNKGPAAGASVAHPHSQVIALPVLDPEIQRSLQGSLEYEKEYGRCVHCTMLNWDLEEGSRVVFENEQFAAVCPFASRVAFEIRVYPKRHSAHFEEMDEEAKDAFAEALAESLGMLYRSLQDPDYNYFIHTAPVDGSEYKHYHWHLEILPKTATWAGFELGTGIEMSTIEPERAAAFLKKYAG